MNNSIKIIAVALVLFNVSCKKSNNNTGVNSGGGNPSAASVTDWGCPRLTEPSGKTITQEEIFALKLNGTYNLEKAEELSGLKDESGIEAYAVTTKFTVGEEASDKNVSSEVTCKNMDSTTKNGLSNHSKFQLTYVFPAIKSEDKSTEKTIDYEYTLYSSKLGRMDEFKVSPHDTSKDEPSPDSPDEDIPGLTFKIVQLNAGNTPERIAIISNYDANDTYKEDGKGYTTHSQHVYYYNLILK